VKVAVAPAVPGWGALRPLSIGDVRIGPGFWGSRQQLNGDVIIDHCRSWMDREGWIANFRVPPGERRGREFTDADVYKLVEAMCWESARSGRDDLRGTIASLGGLIAGAQEPDGYLNTRFGHQGLDARYRDLEWGHELYCAGHLFQAGVARLRTGEGSDDPLAAAVLRAADHVCLTFGDSGNQGVDGHPVVETGLVELYRATCAERYLEQARRFVSRRGRPALGDIGFGRSYFQDDVPVRSAVAFRGHAVRALYLAAGVVDVAVETDDRELLEIVAAQWQRTVAARTYLTGGMGSRHEGESFGEDHELPPDRAYAETCAGVASIQLAWRLLLATGESRYADLIERTLYNVVATAVAPDGRSFFYTNPLQVRVPPSTPDPAAPSPRAAAGLRAPWYDVSCCPPNVARLLASLSAYVATTSVDGGGVQLHQFVPGRVRAGSVVLQISTDYPASGRVVVRVDDGPADPWRLDVRVPGWSGGIRFAVGDQVGEATSGYASVERAWRPGDELVVDLPVQPRWTYPEPQVDAVRGCVAVERGPIVYCAESSAADTAAEDLSLVSVDDTSDPTDTADPSDRPGSVHVGELELIPYHLWGNRGPATMRVWLPVAERRP
jgi:DUF1680 family protein